MQKAKSQKPKAGLRYFKKFTIEKQLLMKKQSSKAALGLGF